MRFLLASAFCPAGLLVCWCAFVSFRCTALRCAAAPTFYVSTCTQQQQYGQQPQRGAPPAGGRGPQYPQYPQQQQQARHPFELDPAEVAAHMAAQVS